MERHEEDQVARCAGAAASVGARDSVLAAFLVPPSPAVSAPPTAAAADATYGGHLFPPEQVTAARSAQAQFVPLDAYLLPPLQESSPLQGS